MIPSVEKEKDDVGPLCDEGSFLCWLYQVMNTRPKDAHCLTESEPFMLMSTLCPDRRHLQKAEQVLNPVPLIGFLTGMYVFHAFDVFVFRKNMLQQAFLA